jgi:hypothetical protein
LELLARICLRCLQGTVSGSLSKQFAKEIVEIKSSCCEFLEILMTNLEIQIN